MAKNKELYNKIKEILIKKAEGYFYSEESLEYVLKPQQDDQLCFDDVIKKKNDKKSISQEPFNLVKKKVTSHYIPPDMLAIKILLENFGEKMSENQFETMSESELIEYKNNLITNINELLKEEKNEH